mmetsp:Transcript_16416/g.36271  ORF Transcript_16416/g.36271 Transcript_16416/m.36271 type:complete len:305 (+) Transcript_16416:826-1740(+)
MGQVPTISPSYSRNVQLQQHSGRLKYSHCFSAEIPNLKLLGHSSLPGDHVVAHPLHLEVRSCRCRPSIPIGFLPMVDSGLVSQGINVPHVQAIALEKDQLALVYQQLQGLARWQARDCGWSGKFDSLCLQVMHIPHHHPIIQTNKQFVLHVGDAVEITKEALFGVHFTYKCTIRDAKNLYVATILPEEVLAVISKLKGSPILSATELASRTSGSNARPQQAGEPLDTVPVVVDIGMNLTNVNKQSSPSILPRGKSLGIDGLHIILVIHPEHLQNEQAPLVVCTCQLGNPALRDAQRAQPVETQE